jgi:hypothetical protein
MEKLFRACSIKNDVIENDTNTKGGSLDNDDDG